MDPRVKPAGDDCGVAATDFIRSEHAVARVASRFCASIVVAWERSGPRLPLRPP
jgi:hypothetical protein